MKRNLVSDARSILQRASIMIDRLLEQERLLGTMKLFRNVVYIWLFYHTAVLLPFIDQVWGHDVFFTRRPFAGGGDWINGFLRHPLVQPYYREFIYLHLACLGAGVLGFLPRLLPAVIWFTTLNVDNHSFPMMDGGNNLSHLLLFYMIFINSTGKPVGGRLRTLRIGISNFAVLAAQLQVAFVYLCAGWYKLSGNLWQNGMSLYYIAQNEDYSLPWFTAFASQYIYLSTLSTYMVVLFQIVFPFMVWSRRSKPIVLLFGTLFHLGISFGMGLFSFGLFMCISYLLFFEDSWIRAFRRAWDFEGRLVVGFDENCAICQKFARLLKILDIQDVIASDGAHRPASAQLQSIPYEDRLEAIYAWDEGRQAFVHGFEAIALIFGKMLLTRPFFPFMKMMDYAGLGDLIYRKIARSRLRKSCSEGACELRAYRQGG